MTLLRLLVLCLVIYIVYAALKPLLAAVRKRRTRRASAKRWCSTLNAKPMWRNQQPWRARESFFAARNALSAI